MLISREVLADAGSPEALVKRILQAEPNLPVPVPIQELCARLGILKIEDVATDEFEGSLVTDAKRSEGTTLAKRGGEPRRRFTIAHELGHFLMAVRRCRDGSGSQQRTEGSLRDAAAC